MLFLLAWLSALAADPGRGEVLAGLSGCVACHTAPEGEPLAGGHGIVTEHGTFYGSNLTPDPEHGLGAWDLADFERAMRHGRAPDGHAYYPAFPYTAFTRLTETDLADLWAWLQTQPAVAEPDREHELTGRAARPSQLGLWRMLYFSPQRPPRDLSDPVDLGRYWVEGPGHCGGCHTPRNRHGAEISRRDLWGNPEGPEPAPDLTPAERGLAGWSQDDLVTLLELGMLPDGNFVGGEMYRIVEEGTARLTDADREAIAAWVLSRTPSRERP